MKEPQKVDLEEVSEDFYLLQEDLLHDLMLNICNIFGYVSQTAMSKSVARKIHTNISLLNNTVKRFVELSVKEGVELYPDFIESYKLLTELKGIYAGLLGLEEEDIEISTKEDFNDFNQILTEQKVRVPFINVKSL
jgi:hypothetical protein